MGHDATNYRPHWRGTFRIAIIAPTNALITNLHSSKHTWINRDNQHFVSAQVPISIAKNGHSTHHEAYNPVIVLASAQTSRKKLLGTSSRTESRESDQ